ncbi:MAG: beta-galactosidase [Candidatus Hydrogenedentes bacterium]|nr:beta-galactosidase [Candidatus Hydrogenedentota bacterium]
MNRFLTLLLLAWLGAWSTVAPAAGDPAPLPFHTLPLESPGARVSWASPLAGGPLRVVAIAPYGAFGDLAQLRSYIELELETVAVWDEKHLGFDPQFPEPNFPDAAYEQVAKRLERLLEKRKFDVILLAHFNPDILPESVQQRIIEHAGNGVGLLATGAALEGTGPLAQWLKAQPALETPPPLTRGIGPLGIPETEQQAMVQCYGGEQNRLTTLNFQNAPSPNHCLVPVPGNPFDMLPEYEANAFSLVCKALLWVADRAPALNITSVLDIAPKGPDDEEIPPGYPPEFIEAVRNNAFNQPIRPFVLNLDAPAEEACEVLYRVRIPGSSMPSTLVDPDTVLTRGATYYALDIIAAPGDYLIDFWLKNRKGVLAWHTEVLSVPGWPQLEQVTVKKDGQKAVWLKPNDHLDIGARVPALGVLGSDQEATVLVRATDSLGRQVASATQTVGSTGAEINLRLDLADLLAPLIRVEVHALPSGLVNQANFASLAARETFYFPVRMPEPPSAPEVILSTSGPFDYGAQRQIIQLRDLIGAGTLHTPLNADSLLASSKAGLNRIARLGTLDIGEVGDGAVRIPCLSAPEYQRTEKATVAAGVLQAWAGGPPCYSLGAGCALTATEAEVCQSPHCLGKFREYLKRQYPDLETLNATWRESFSSWDEVVPWPLDQCQQHRIWAPWLDFRRAMDLVFAEAQNAGREATRSVDPAARVGFQARSGALTPMTGYNWQWLARATDYMAVPARPGAIRRLQAFHGPRPFDGIVLGHEDLLADPAAARWAAWNALLHQLPAIWLEQPFSAGSRSLISPVGELRPGLADLATALATFQEGIGTLLLNAEPAPTGIAFVDSPATRYLDYANPGLKRGSDTSENALEKTLNRNGFSTRVRSLESGSDQGQLDGINTLILCRTRALSDQECEVLKTFHENNGLIIADGQPGELDGHGAPRAAVALPFLHPLDTETPEDDADLWTNRPVWVTQSGVNAADHDAVLAHLLGRAGNSPMLPIQEPEKQQGAQARFQFTYGAATLAAFLPEPGTASTTRRASFKIPDDHYATDLLHPMDTVPRGRVQWTVTAGEPALFSILPYRVEELRMDAPETAVAGQRTVLRIHLDTGDATPGTHLLLLRFLGPEGVELKHYRQSIPVEGGFAETFIPLAQNEFPGTCEILLTDLLTRQSVSYLMDVIAP